MKPSPPLFALKFLRWFCREDFLEEVEGDLIEVFEYQYQQSPKKARSKFIWTVIRYFRPEFIKTFSSQNSTTMYQHNIKLTIRNFSKYKSSFFINLIGLTTGLASTIFIYLWVADELSINKFHSKDKQIYQVMLNQEEDGKLRTTPDTQGILAEALSQEVPEVLMAVEDTNSEWFGENFALSGGKEFYKGKGKFSGKQYFELFSFPFTMGNAEQALKDKKAIVISESMAKRLFGSLDEVIGKSIQWQLLHFKGEAKVTGVFKDVPKNSTDQFDFVIPFIVFKEIVGDGMHWGNYNAYTYVELAKSTNVAALNNKIADFVKKKVEWSNVTPFFVQYSKNYLYGTYENGKQSGGRILYVRLFMAVGIFVLLIACINFMNLSTARASRRLKEIGVKKTLGAARNSLVAQFIGEAVLITILSLVLAVGVVILLLPQFNEITGKLLSLQFNTHFVLASLIITVFTGIVAGSYPALYLSGFKPASILKGKLNTSTGELWTRKGLVVFQFTLSIILVATVIVVYQQLNYIQTKNLGYEKEGILKIPMEGKAVENSETFFESLKQIPGIINATATSHPLVKGEGYTTGVNWPGKDPDIAINFGQARVYYDFIETMGMELKEGRGFSKAFTNEKSKLLFNEAAIEIMGLKDPIGTMVNLWGEEKEIIGVVKNFNFSSLHDKVGPIVLHFDTEFLPYAMVKVNTQNIPQTIGRINTFYHDFNPDYTFEYQFLDQNYQAQYIAEERVSKLASYFATIAIIISCLGLFGLAAFTAERRQKEIGIRKILGAGNMKIVRLLSGEFTKMVIVSIVIGLPISYVAAQYWLKGFAYSIELNWWVFASSGILALVISWLTVGFQTLRAARMKVLETLKSE